MAVIVLDNMGDTKVIGPFANGEEATRFGFAELAGEDWYWVPLTPPRKESK